MLQRFLGLVNGSLNGLYNGSHIICSYKHLLTIDPHQPESLHVKNLTNPLYIILARGPANRIGECLCIDFTQQADGLIHQVLA